MNHKISNIGPGDIMVIDRDERAFTVAPGAFIICDSKRILHSERPARYTVEPVAQ